MVTNLKTETEKEMYTRLYVDEQKPYTKIAQEVGLTKRQVMKKIHDYKIRRHSIKDIPDQYFIDAKEKGMTTSDIQAEIGFSASGINRRLRECGFFTRTHRNTPKPSYEVLYRNYIRLNMSKEQLAEKYGVSKDCVRKWLEEDEIFKESLGMPLSEKIELYERYLAINEYRGRPSYEELYIFYVKRRWKAIDLAIEYKQPEHIVLNWLQSYELTLESVEEIEDTFGMNPQVYIPKVSREEFAKMVGILPNTLEVYFVAARKEMFRTGQLEKGVKERIV